MYALCGLEGQGACGRYKMFSEVFDRKVICQYFQNICPHFHMSLDFLPNNPRSPLQPIFRRLKYQVFCFLLLLFLCPLGW